ncbi:MAG: glycosyltransferase family 1 protein [Steroidobacteraceae bacterium]
MIDVVLDCIIFDLQASGGVSRYWVNLIFGLAQLPEPPRLHLLIAEDANSESARQVIELARRNSALELYPYESRLLERIRQPEIPKDLAARAVFHSSYHRSAARMPNVLTVHDFTYEERAGGWRAFAQHWQKSQAIGRSSTVVCVSESTRQDFRRRFPAYRQSPVEVIHHGVEPHFAPDPNPASGLRDQPEYVLFVGRRDPYKNFWLVVEAVKQLGTLMLTIVGPPLSIDEQTRLDLEIRGRYSIRSHVDDVQLVNLYRNAFALAFPSRYEGFGFPVIEAMACGCPVVALNISSIPEVAGDAAILLDADAPELLVAALEDIRSVGAREALVRRGMAQAARFSWADAAAKYFALYAKLSSSGASA